MVLKGGSVTTIYFEVSSGLTFSLFNSYLAFCVWHRTFSISHPLFYISHLAFYLTPRIFYFTSRIFLSHTVTSHFLFHISHFLSYRLPFIPQTFLEGQSNVTGWEKRSPVSFRRPYTASRTTSSLYVLSQLKKIKIPISFFIKSQKAQSNIKLFLKTSTLIMLTN